MNDSKCKNLVYVDGRSWPCHRAAKRGYDGHCRICAAAIARGKKATDKKLAEYREQERESDAARARGQRAVNRLAKLGFAADVHYQFSLRGLGRYTGKVIIDPLEVLERLEEAAACRECGS